MNNVKEYVGIVKVDRPIICTVNVTKNLPGESSLIKFNIYEMMLHGCKHAGLNIKSINDQMYKNTIRELASFIKVTNIVHDRFDYGINTNLYILSQIEFESIVSSQFSFLMTTKEGFESMVLEFTEIEK